MESMELLKKECSGSYITYLRWPSGGAGQAVLNFVQALKDQDHIVLFYERNFEWGLDRHPYWLEQEISKFARIIFLKPLLDSIENLNVSYEDYIEHFNGINYFKKCLQYARGFFHHWINRDKLLEGIKTKFPRICISHSRFELKQGYDYYIFPSEYGFSLHNEVDENKKFIINNAIDVEKWTPNKNNIDNYFRFGRVSSFHHSKFPDNYVVRIEKIIKREKQLLHTIVGSGSLYDQFKSEIKQRNVESNIQLPGELVGSELIHQMQNFDVLFYFTGTHIETHPIALLESLACGIPIISEPKGGIPEIVINDKTGMNCQSWDEAVNYLFELKRSKALRDHLSVESRKHSQLFTLDIHRDKWTKFLTTT